MLAFELYCRKKQHITDTKTDVKTNGIEHPEIKPHNYSV
jgi:hypothetical protein